MIRSREEIAAIFGAALRAVSPALRDAAVVAELYPYIGLSHTIRRAGGCWRVRISDHCADAPRPVLEAIATLLACKVARRAVPLAARELYARYRRSTVVVERVRRRRLERGRKRIDPSPGAHHDLDAVFRELSLRHFEGRLEVADLGWGPRRSWTRLGHYDIVHDTITISPVLDSPDVPRQVLAYVVFHEMLHAWFAARVDTQARRHHSPEFRCAEGAFPGAAEARRFLAGFCRRRRDRECGSIAAPP